MINIKSKKYNIVNNLVFKFLVLAFLFPTSKYLLALGVCKWDSNGVVISDAPRGQGNDLCIIGDGYNGAIIVWTDDRNDIISYYDIYVQRIDSLGNCLWTANGVPVVTASLDQHLPCIVTDGCGGAIITWQDERSGMDVYAQRIDSIGNCLWMANGIPICADSGAEVDPCITTDGYGGAIIAWQSDPGWPPIGSQFGIYAQRVDGNGNTRWTINGIAVAPDHDSLYQTRQQIISDGAGGAIICWQQVEDTTSSPDYDIYAQRVDSLGNLMWGNKGVAICSTQYNTTYPEIITDNANGAIIVWSDNRNGNWDIYAQRIDVNGVLKWSLSGIPICIAESTQAYRRIVSGLEGGGVVIWGDARNGNADIYAQRIDSTGNCLWLINGIPVCMKPGTQTWTSICSDLAGGAIIVWQDTVPIDRNFWDIYCQRIDTNGNCLWQPGGLGTCTHDSTQQRPVIVSDNTTGGAIIAWQDSRNRFTTRHDVFAQRVGDTIIVGLKEMTEDKYRVTNIGFEVSPNPFRRFLGINVSALENKNASLKIYDIAGRCIKTFFDNHNLSSNTEHLIWDGIDEAGKKVSSGIYFCVLKTKSHNVVRKILFIE